MDTGDESPWYDEDGQQVHATDHRGELKDTSLLATHKDLPVNAWRRTYFHLDVATLKELYIATINLSTDDNRCVLPFTVKQFIQRWSGLHDGDGKASCMSTMVTCQLGRVIHFIDSVYGSDSMTLVPHVRRDRSPIILYQTLNAFNSFGVPHMIRSWLCYVYATRQRMHGPGQGFYPEVMLHDDAKEDDQWCGVTVAEYMQLLTSWLLFNCTHHKFKIYLDVIFTNPQILQLCTKFKVSVPADLSPRTIACPLLRRRFTIATSIYLPPVVDFFGQRLSKRPMVPRGDIFKHGLQ